MKVDAEALGKRIAQRYLLRGLPPNLRELAAQLGVQIIVQDHPPQAQPGLRAEYRHEPPQILLYRDPLELLSGALHANQRFDLLACNLEDVHLAHELFHHLEFGRRFGPLRPEEVEAAAQGFAERLLGLAFHPDELAELEPEA